MKVKVNNNHSGFKLAYCVFLLLFMMPAFSKAQVAQGDTTKTKTDTPIVKKRFWRASGEWMLVQLIPWSYNYFIRDAEFAHVTWSSIGHNLQFKNWEWDDNNFKTNQFAHPYHGSMYFNSFRTNGYSFWQSAPAALAGSYVWEIAGETHPPAPNDLINTTLGGIVLGEMEYRVANRILNKKQRGFKRQANEFFAFLINPMNGFNRILDGQWGRVSTAPETELDTMAMIGELDLGARRINEENDNTLKTGKTTWYARVRLLYGDPYKASKTPFNNFNLRAEVSGDDSAALNNISVNGLITSWELRDVESTKHLLSITANYDYYHNASFEYGGQSANLSLYSLFKTGKKTTIYTRVGAGWVILGAVPNAYLYYGEGRDYDFGTGFSLLGQLLITTGRFSGLFDYSGKWFTTLNGSDSHYFLHFATGELRYRMFKNISVAAEGGNFLLNGYYADFDDIHSRYPFVRFSIGIRI
jgi:hypothetical protein